MPVTSSVTGCSTCSRVFISRKTNRPRRRPPGTRRSRRRGTPRLAASTAAASIRSRSPAETPGDGVSSTIFWWRRCTEQSRSPSASTRPSARPRICTSTCRARSRSARSRSPAAEEPLRARAGGLEAGRRPASSAADAHADAAAAGRRLDHDGIADPSPRRRAAATSVTGSRLPGGRHAGPRHQVPGPDLVAHRSMASGRGPTQRGRRRSPAGEVRVLGEKAVAGMHCRRPVRRAAATIAATQVMRAAGPAPICTASSASRTSALGVGVGVDGDRADPDAPGRADDPPGDLAAVGDQHQSNIKPA